MHKHIPQLEQWVPLAAPDRLQDGEDLVARNTALAIIAHYDEKDLTEASYVYEARIRARVAGEDLQQAGGSVDIINGKPVDRPPVRLNDDERRFLEGMNSVVRLRRRLAAPALVASIVLGFTAGAIARPKIEGVYRGNFAEQEEIESGDMDGLRDEVAGLMGYIVTAFGTYKVSGLAFSGSAQRRARRLHELS